MQSLLQQHDLADAGWTLEPVDHSENKDDADDGDSGQNSSTSTSGSHLTVILRNALRLARRRQQQQQSASRTNPTNTAAAGTVVFLGMDCPEVPVAELRAAVTRNRSNDTATTSEALLCPAADGGYGMLAVSLSTNGSNEKLFGCFDGVPWSHPLTAVAQLKALTDAGCCVTLGPLMHDIDTPDDVTALCERMGGSSGAVATTLEQQQQSADDENCLRRPSAWVAAAAAAEDDEDNSIRRRCAALYCQYTKQALKELGRL